MREPWILTSGIAALHLPRFRAALRLDAPQQGLGDLVVEDAALPGNLLGLEVMDAHGATMRCVDAYVRGRDLAATYRVGGQPLSVQVYWRVNDAHGDDLACFDLIASIQTPAWESFPQLEVRTSLAGERRQLASVQRDQESAELWRIDMHWSYAEASRGGDFTPAEQPAATPDSPPISGSRWVSDGRFMERGVIRRLQMRGAIVARRHDEEAARAICPTLLREQPPLTA